MVFAVRVQANYPGKVKKCINCVRAVHGESACQRILEPRAREQKNPEHKKLAHFSVQLKMFN